MSRQFEPGRALEITSPKYGSGYRIGGRLVLTAGHLLAEVGSTCRVRAKQSFGEEDAKVVWKAQGWDIALIVLPESVPACQSVVLGRLPEAQVGEKLEFQMYGWPLWGRTQRDGGKTAGGGRQIEGLIYLADRSPDGLLVLEAQRLPPEATTKSSNKKENSDDKKENSEWEGVSGAAIACDGLIIAVQSRHQNPKRSASLEASPLWTIYTNQQWCDLLKEHGISSKPELVVLKNSLVSSWGINYQKLQDLLKARKWKEADQETAERMLQATGKHSWSDVDFQDILDFPCQDLETINRLWSENSGGKFGFSKQKEIYTRCGANLDAKYPGDEIWKEFCNRVGWRVNSKYIQIKQTTYDVSAPDGHLPAIIAHLRFYDLWLFLFRLVFYSLQGLGLTGVWNSISRQLMDWNNIEGYVFTSFLLFLPLWRRQQWRRKWEGNRISFLLSRFNKCSLERIFK
jgi:GUN4-like